MGNNCPDATVAHDRGFEFRVALILHKAVLSFYPYLESKEELIDSFIPKVITTK